MADENETNDKYNFGIDTNFKINLNFDKPSKITKSFRMTGENAKWLKKYASKIGVTESHIVNEMLDKIKKATERL